MLRSGSRVTSPIRAAGAGRDDEVVEVGVHPEADVLDLAGRLGADDR